MKCDRCGKEIKKGDPKYKITIPPILGESATYVWCEGCHNEFVNNVKTGRQIFDNTHLSIEYAEYKEHVKQLLKAFERFNDNKEEK